MKIEKKFVKQKSTTITKHLGVDPQNLQNMKDSELCTDSLIIEATGSLICNPSCNRCIEIRLDDVGSLYRGCSHSTAVPTRSIVRHFQTT